MHLFKKKNTGTRTTNFESFFSDSSLVPSMRGLYRRENVSVRDYLGCKKYIKVRTMRVLHKRVKTIKAIQFEN